MADKLSSPQPSRPSQRKVDEDGKAEFFAPVTTGYQRTSDNEPGAGIPPPQPQAQPQAPPPAAARTAPPPKPEFDLSTAKGASEALANTMVQSFVDRMKAAAEAKGGHLTVQDLEDMQDDFDRQTRALSGALENGFLNT